MVKVTDLNTSFFRRLLTFHRFFLLSLLLLFPLSGYSAAIEHRTSPIIADHTTTDLSAIPDWAIREAKKELFLSYGHASHGSQLVYATRLNLMMDIDNGDLYAINRNGDIEEGILSFHDNKPGPGTYIWKNPSDDKDPDTYNWKSHEDSNFYTWEKDPNYPNIDIKDVYWVSELRAYLNNENGKGPTRNVVMMAWCSSFARTNDTDIKNYLDRMQELEDDYEGVVFVYMTGPLSGDGKNKNIHEMNEIIRAHCRTHNKVLFDFEDIESYNPDGKYFENSTQSCSYTDDYGETKNWATEWCRDKDPHDNDYYLCQDITYKGNDVCHHTEALSCNLKAAAFWWMLARIAGWTPPLSNDDLVHPSDDIIQARYYTNSARQGIAPLTVKFQDFSVNAPTEWQWDFDNDGTIDSTIPNPVHTYGAAGTYSVKLIVTDADGFSSEVTKEKLIVVKEKGHTGNSDFPWPLFMHLFNGKKAELAMLAAGDKKTAR